MDGSQISCAVLRALALNSRRTTHSRAKEDPELEHIYRYLENPDDGSVNATVCEGRKIITPFSKLINVTEGAEYVGRNIEKLFDEARQNMRNNTKIRCECTVHDNPTRLAPDRHVQTILYEGQRRSVIGQVDRHQENSKGPRKPRVRRVTVANQIRVRPGWEIPRLKRSRVKWIKGQEGFKEGPKFAENFLQGS
ncbi:hypothetical protein TNCV_2755161 [Trichonephila clavipes]|nr:hypothetical protein TNCV_2755161 [Trichonephila clavipes]